MAIDFQSMLQARQGDEEQEAAKSFFLQHIEPHLTPQEKAALLDAINSKDIATYFSILEPILFRRSLTKVGE